MPVAGNKLCICMVVTTDVMFDGRVLKEASTLTKAGYTVHVLYSYRQNSKPLAKSNTRLWWHPIRIVSERLPKHPLILLFLYVEFSLRSIISIVRLQPDVVHAHDLDTLIPAYLASRLTNALLVYDAHELWTERVRVPFRGIWHRLQDYVLPKADAVITVNPERAEVIFEEYGAKSYPVVVQNCPEIQSIFPVSPLTALLAERGIRNKRIILYHGALNPGRFLAELVLSTEYYPDDTVLVLLGHNDRYRQDLSSIALGNHVEDRVVFLPPVPSSQLVQIASGADVGIVFYENSCRNNYLCAPNKLYEYLMAGLPVIVNDLPGMANFVRDNRVGRIIGTEVTPSDIGIAVTAILCDSPTTILETRQRARKIAESAMNWTAQSQALISLYDTLA